MPHAGPALSSLMKVKKKTDLWLSTFIIWAVRARMGRGEKRLLKAVSVFLHSALAPTILF